MPLLSALPEKEECVLLFHLSSEACPMSKLKLTLKKKTLQTSIPYDLDAKAWQKVNEQ